MSAAHTLVVRHVKDKDNKDTDPPVFTVCRLSDNKSGPQVAVAAPNSVRVEGRPNDNLTSQLRWYLEDFLDYPFSPDTEYAERVQAALRAWGQQAFRTLFGSEMARDFYRDATRSGMANLTVRIVSDSPFVLGWPWEALEDPAVDPLAHQCAIERWPEKQADPAPPGHLPADCVNVLLVIARPLEGDVRYRSVSRSLVELAADHAFPVSVHVLRPPTLDGLRRHLEANPNRYHVLHFDGHGAYGDGSTVPGGGHAMGAVGGKLLFETADGKKDPVEAGVLSSLLRKHAVPAVVLNACQSAMIDPKAADPFASVAAALLKGGTRTVVAMAYSLYVSGAQQFLPEFYRTLFASGKLAEAVRAGRQQMLAQRGRVCARGLHELNDWLVPVVYQQDPLDFTFVAGKQPVAGPTASRLPEEARDDRNPYGFVGRDRAILALERAMHRSPAAVVISGLGGVGKTTLAKGFLRWLEQTGGLGAGALWFDFRTIRSAEYVLNRIGEALTGRPEFATLGVPEKLKFLADACKKTQVRIVWDNFESAKGIAGTGVAGNLSNDDTKWLNDLLTGLRGGATKVLITSRSEEEWLDEANVGAPVPLGGLDGEERWAFANAILTDFGQAQNPREPNPDVKVLVELLKGHPLAMRVMLPKLKKRSAAQLADAIRTNLAAVVGTGDDSAKALTATLRFVTESLPAEWQPVLVPLGLHEEYASADLLEMMAQRVEGGPSRSVIDACLTGLGTAGLVRDLGRGIIFELHPLLTSHLRAAAESLPRDDGTRAFVNVMAGLADNLTPRPFHQQRGWFSLHEGNFHAARAIAERLGMDVAYAALTQSLGSFAENTHNYPVAAALYDHLQAHFGRTGDEKRQAVAFHQLGNVAELRRDFKAAEGWYRKSLAIEEQLGNEHGAAITYHQLGIVAQERRDFDAAEESYRKAVKVFERLGDEHGAASTYHQLGIVAEERRDFDAAEVWYRKSLAIKERLGDEHGAAITYHQLGMVAEERQDFDAAWAWFLQSRATLIGLGDGYTGGIATRSLIRSYGNAPAEVRPRLLALGREAGLSDELLQQIKSAANSPATGG